MSDEEMVTGGPTMHDELVRRLRDAAKMSEALAVLLPNSDGSATAKLYNEAADVIEELSVVVRAQKAVLDKFQSWIPVVERLPEAKEIVQITDGINTGHGYFDGTWHSPFCDIDAEHITHWMPLPEPPKKEV